MNKAVHISVLPASKLTIKSQIAKIGGFQALPALAAPKSRHYITIDRLNTGIARKRQT
jgi:hypothetical protein